MIKITNPQIIYGTRGVVRPLAKISLTGNPYHTDGP